MVFINKISFNGKKWKGGEIYDPASGKYAYASGKLKDGNLIWRFSLDKAGILGANNTWGNVVAYALFRKTAAELEVLVPNKRYK